MFDRVWKPKEKFILVTLTTMWLVLVLLFWIWWFQPSHIGTIPGFILTTLVLSWSIMLPGYCFFFLIKMRRPSANLEIPSNLRVSVVVTKAPSEPFSLVQKTLEGILSLHGKHHTWVADEDPTPQELEWYERQRRSKLS